MITFSKLNLAFWTLLAIGSLAARAENISGSYSNDCGNMVKLWDLSGNYYEDNGVETESFTLNIDAAGNVTGTGLFHLSDSAYSVFLDGDFIVSGKVSSAGTVTRLQLTLTTTSGSGYVNGYAVTCKVTEKENFEVDSSNRELVGKGSGKIKITLIDYGKSISQPVPPGYVSVPMPAAADGEWGLSLNTTANGKSYLGNGAVSLSNGRKFDLGLTGTYSAKTGISKVSLKSADSTKPLTLSLTATCDSDDLYIQTLKGKVMGQNLKYSH